MNAADSAAGDAAMHSFFHSGQAPQAGSYFGLQYHHLQQQQYTYPDLLNLERRFDPLQAYNNGNNDNQNNNYNDNNSRSGGTAAAQVNSYGVSASAPANFVFQNNNQHTNANRNNIVSNNNNSSVTSNGEAGSTAPSRYESQKRRDWNTFGQYLRNHRPPLALHKCSGAHVLEFLRYLDQFGKTKVHMQGCPFYGQAQPPAACACPLRQAWGSLDALIGRLRAAFEENGGKPESNPFGARAVRLYLREVRESQAKARGIAYEKKKRKRQPANSGANTGAGNNSSSATAGAAATNTATPNSSSPNSSSPPPAACVSSSPSPAPSPTVSSISGFHLGHAVAAAPPQQLILPPAPSSSLFINSSDNLSAAPPPPPPPYNQHLHQLHASSLIPSFN